MVRNNGHLAAGAVLAGFGIYVISVAAQLPYVSEVGPGPGFFPLWLGIGLLLFATGLMFGSLRSSANETAAESRSEQRVATRSLAGWFAVMIAIALLRWVGFVLSFIVLTIFLIVALERRPVSVAIAVGLGLAVAFHVIFTVALNVTIPKAVWGF
jgi:putative tricarboxylic transport membrane protein